MKLQDVRDLCQLEWSEDGIQLPSNFDTFTLFKFFREAILDNHLFVHKCIGFKPTSRNGSNGSNTNPTRDPSIGESYLELATIINKILFILPPEEENLVYKAKVVTGRNKLSELHFNSGYADSPNILALAENDYLCNVITRNSQTFTVFLDYACGYKSMSDIRFPSEYTYVFPINATFSIMNFINIIPDYSGNRIRYRLKNGLSAKYLQYLFKRYADKLPTLEGTEGELKWLKDL